MAYSVLILDDDVDFNSLLTDIFEQADYVITSMDDPVRALEVFETSDFDLVVTDHRMPEMTGSEFLGSIKKIKPKTPVIVVSGFLENDTIRKLISGGVGGVFLKPLNIFSLLERTSELIEEARRLDQGEGQVATLDDSGVDVASSAFVDLGFPFRSFPCKSEVSAEFAERLHSLKNFKSNLSLIGEPGTHFRLICEDIRGFSANDKEKFLYLTVSSFDVEQVLSKFDEAKKNGAERLTCVLLDVEAMSDEQKGLAVLLSKCEGPFESIAMPFRTIFCVSGDLDMLFDEGGIDEDLYILMGTAEVRVPALRECVEDVAIIAQQLVVDVIREKGLSSVCRFEASAREYLSQCPWDHNYEQLRATVRRVMDSNVGNILTLAEVTSAVQSTLAASPRARFESRLSHARVDYVRAASILLGGEKAKVAAFYGTDTMVVESMLQ